MASLCNVAILLAAFGESARCAARTLSAGSRQQCQPGGTPITVVAYSEALRRWCGGSGIPIPVPGVVRGSAGLLDLQATPTTRPLLLPGALLEDQAIYSSTSSRQQLSPHTPATGSLGATAGGRMSQSPFGQATPTMHASLSTVAPPSTSVLVQSTLSNVVTVVPAVTEALMCTAYVTCVCDRGSHVINETDVDGCVHCRCVATEEEIQGEPSTPNRVGKPVSLRQLEYRLQLPGQWCRAYDGHARCKLTMYVRAHILLFFLAVYHTN